MEQLDDAEPSLQRQIELRAAYERNGANGEPPYANVEIRTRGELLWAMRERGWSGELLAAATADFRRARFAKTNLYSVDLIGADLSGADFSDANLPGGHLHKANLSGARMSGANLSGCDLRSAVLKGCTLRGSILTASNLFRADFSSADLYGADLSEAYLFRADLSNATMFRTLLSSTELMEADLSGVDLRRTNLSTTSLLRANLSGADLREVHMSVDTNLSEVTLSSHTLLADVTWYNAPLARVWWEKLTIIGDETEARRPRDSNGNKKVAKTRRVEYAAAVRAYRLLVVALRSQGLNEHADRYAVRAQLMRRKELRLQHNYLRWLGSLFLWLIAGYGYRPLRSLAAYVATISVFALLYWCVTNDVSLTHGLFGQLVTWLGMRSPASASDHLQGYEAVVVSMTSFHGRGFFQPAQTPGDKVAILASIEATIGLFLEITFIATFTQRFFAR